MLYHDSISRVTESILAAKPRSHRRQTVVMSVEQPEEQPVEHDRDMIDMHNRHRRVSGRIFKAASVCRLRSVWARSVGDRFFRVKVDRRASTVWRRWQRCVVANFSCAWFVSAIGRLAMNDRSSPTQGSSERVPILAVVAWPGCGGAVVERMGNRVCESWG